MQRRLSLLVTPNNASSVKYFEHYKANDIKPLAPELYPQYVRGFEWWAWADLDVIFGDLLKFMRRSFTRPACCKVPLRPNGEPRSTRLVNVYLHKAACPCPEGAQVNVMTPLYPNPWRKKAWGPFTAFRTGRLGAPAAFASSVEGTASTAAAVVGGAGEAPMGTHLYLKSPAWKGVIEGYEYAHFDEWWGPFHYSRGWETMGDVLTRLAESSGEVIMSKVKLPFAEAKSCRDMSCSFCPCGALRARLHSASDVMLTANEVEVMLLHLAESKYAWEHSGLTLEPWTHGGWHARQSCIDIRGMGHLNATCGSTCTSRAPTFTEFGVHGAVRRATKLTRHRVQTTWAGHIKYATQPSEVRLKVIGAAAGDSGGICSATSGNGGRRRRAAAPPPLETGPYLVG